MNNVSARSPAPLRDVLYELSLAKEVPDAELVDDFARKYPEHAAAITEFAIELVVDHLSPDKAAAPSVATDLSPAVSRAMSKFQNALYSGRSRKKSATADCGVAASATVESPFAKLDRTSFRKLAQAVGANAVLLCKLRDRQVDPKTIRQWFLDLLAEKLGCMKEMLAAYLSAPAGSLQPQFFKADEKPDASLQQSFDEAVKSSGLSAEQQQFLLRE